MKKITKRSAQPASFSQAAGRAWHAMGRRWGDNIPQTAADKRNEQLYLEAHRATADAVVRSKVDALAALNYLLAEDCDFDPQYTIKPILEKVRACIETRLVEV